MWNDFFYKNKKVKKNKNKEFLWDFVLKLKFDKKLS